MAWQVRHEGSPRVVRIHGSQSRIRIRLPGRSRARFRVTVVAHTRSGRALRARRTYRRCV